MAVVFDEILTDIRRSDIGKGKFKPVSGDEGKTWRVNDDEDGIVLEGSADVTASEPTGHSGRIWLDTSTTGDVDTLAIVTKTANYTATNLDTVILCDATSGNITITLPAAAGKVGKVYHVKKIDSSVNTVTVDANASETIDGDLNKVISNQYDAIMIITEGSNWHII